MCIFIFLNETLTYVRLHPINTIMTEENSQPFGFSPEATRGCIKQNITNAHLFEAIQMFKIMSIYQIY